MYVTLSGFGTPSAFAMHPNQPQVLGDQSVMTQPAPTFSTTNEPRRGPPSTVRAHESMVTLVVVGVLSMSGGNMTCWYLSTLVTWAFRAFTAAGQSLAP